MYIAIEGVIGAGKTTLARLLQPVLSAQVVLEEFDANPFLGDFYGDRARFAFQTQIFFLLSRYRQLQQVAASLQTGESVIADYTFAKDRLFACLNLHGDELATYLQVYGALSDKLPQPDLLVYLRASTQTLLRRIEQRDRPYEREMDRDYIEALRNAYDAQFNDATGLPETLVIETNALDFVQHGSHLELVAAQVRAALAGVRQPGLPLGMARPVAA
jgi:deoxyguanosine kinase